jgi:transposase
MSMGKRKRAVQPPLFITHADLPTSPAHPFYAALNRILDAQGFDPFVEGLCEKFYVAGPGRPSLPPGHYFRLLLLGYFEGIDSERGIAWRCGDSLSARTFVGLAIDDKAPDHSTISRTRRLIDLETHREVFTWILKVLAQHKLVDGKTAGFDATTLEANAAMKSIVRKVSGESYDQFLMGLAQAAGIDTPTREDLAKLDKKRKHKASNDDWENPHDPDAKITKMKDGRTHLAHKAEHAVDMKTGALLAMTLQPANAGDTSTLLNTIIAATENLRALSDDASVADAINENWMSEGVADKGYHSNGVMTDLRQINIRSYISEPDRGRRDWTDKEPERDAVYANRRRIRGGRGKELMRRRGELIERGFAHCYDTGGMRRTHLRGHENISKRLVIHGGGFNLGLLMRKLTGWGKPRRLQGLFSLIFGVICGLWAMLAALARNLASPAQPAADCLRVRIAA